MIIQDKLAGVGYRIKPGSEQDRLTYWGVCNYSLFQPKKCYTLSKLVQNTTVFLIFQMMWNVQLNTVHLLLLLAKRNDPVPTDSALPAVTHFLLASLMNTGNAKGVKLSTSANLCSLEDCKTRILANSVPIRSMFSLSSDSMPQVNLQYFQYLRQLRISSASQTDAGEVNAHHWSFLLFWGHYQCARESSAQYQDRIGNKALQNLHSFIWRAKP